jgi:hypothetical protein
MRDRRILWSAVLAFPALAWAQINPLDKVSTSKNSVCPLSDEQTQRSIDAFAKIVPTFTQEPRCANCHGGVNPFSDQLPGDRSDPAAPRMLHGAGAVDTTTDCSGCHDGMLPKRDGSPSTWRLPNPEHNFVGKDATTLCKQMKDAFKQAADFVGHLTDDNGNSNFTGTAFLGNRGIMGADLQPPRGITAGGLVALAKDWVAAMGGEFKGDEECGCKPAHYAIRMSSKTNVNIGPARYETNHAPVDIPIVFQNDGSFAGEGTSTLQGAGTVSSPIGVCTGESSGSIGLRVSGENVQEFQKNFMHVKIENITDMNMTSSAQCPRLSGSSNSGPGTPRITIPFEFEGRVGEVVEMPMLVQYPGVTSSMRLEIVKQD